MPLGGYGSHTENDAGFPYFVRFVQVTEYAVRAADCVATSTELAVKQPPSPFNASGEANSGSIYGPYRIAEA